MEISMPDRERIVAVGLLTQRDLATLGHTFSRAYPVANITEFDDLLRAIDEAEARSSDPRPRREGEGAKRAGTIGFDPLK
jgi:hypothetical protein